MRSARHYQTALEIYDCVPLSRPDKEMVQAIIIPLRLLDCFGFVTPISLAVVVFGARVVVDGGRLGAVLVAGRGTVEVGLLKKAEGEGILIVAISHKPGMVALCAA